MSLLPWIVLGLIAGFSASKIVSRTGQGVVSAGTAWLLAVVTTPSPAMLARLVQ